MSNAGSVNNPIRVNQLGYGTRLPKYVAVLDEKPVYLFDNGGNLLTEYPVPGLSFDEASGDNVYILDLGDIKSGSYTLKSGEYYGTLNSDDIAAIFDILETTKAISTKDKKRFNIRRR